MARKETYEYGGERATVSWHGKLCIHVGECGRATGNLFVAGRKPWCQPDLAADEEVTEVIHRCPTGALSVAFSDGRTTETAPAENTITVACNGPLFVTGDLDIEGAPEGVPGVKFRAALCRCGQSKNKPFCDNSHEDAGFRDYGAVGEAGVGHESAGGPLEIRPVRDGPILIKGNLAITASSGRKAWRGTQVALCRCGQSNNKPFCDGQHKKAGFTSE